jgi:DNA-binding winged helix-turn-helix (wHTH) protein
MSESVSSRRKVRFGVYELDLASGELRKGGLKIRLSGQPFQVLAILVERPGEVVTREQLQKKLWPDGTFVDFDHSLNTAINKIREALGDSAENPRFIETLARRGYRFIAQVEKVGGGQPAHVAAERKEVEVTAGISPLASREEIPQPFAQPGDHLKTGHPGPFLRSRLRRALAIICLFVAAAALYWWLVRQRAAPAQPLRLTRLTSDPGLTFQPTLSPDGSLVAYASDRSGEGNLDIWIQPVASGEPTRITRHVADDYEPAFSPDGGRIVFRSERDGGGVYVVSALGGDARLMVRQGLGEINSARVFCQ